MPPPPGLRSDDFFAFLPFFGSRRPPRSIRRTPTNSSNSQHRTRNQPHILTQTTPPSSNQNRLQAENEHLNIKAAVLINAFHAKTRQPVASELKDDMSCTLCSEVFLCGSNPEVPVRLDCGHIFGTSCILKWLSPASRDGKNSCPVCRKPVFDDWDKMDIPAPREPAQATRRVAPAAISQDNSTPAPREPARATAQRLIRQHQNMQDYQTAVAEASRAFETSTFANAMVTLQLAGAHMPYDATQWQAILSRVRVAQRELECAFGPGLITQWYVRRIAPEASTEPVEATRPSEDEEYTDGVTAEFNNAEHDLRQQRETTRERKRYMWMQFCEGVVRTIEQSDDSTAVTNHDLALTIINMKKLDDFMAERADESPTWRRILQIFPNLHTEMVTRFHDFRSLPSVNIDHCMELERLLASARFDRATLHRSRWHFRLSERLATAARSAELVADVRGPQLEWACAGRGEVDADEGGAFVA